jgi:hypothetical protein
MIRVKINIKLPRVFLPSFLSLNATYSKQGKQGGKEKEAFFSMRV